MQINSVRELKAALSDQVLSALVKPVQVRSLSLSARPMAALSGGPATLALGIARRKKKGEFDLAVRVQQRALETGPHMELIKKQAKGEVDVRYIGRVAKQAALPWHQKRNRPLRIGGSIGHYQVTAGTLGCFVRRRSDGAVLVLSNNHVLANENKANKGDAILQPGKYDGGKNPADAVAKLAEFVKLKTAGANKVDCAVAAVNDAIKYNHRTLTGLGKLAGLGDALLDEGTEVAKVGRTTGPTHGRVTAFELDNVVISYDLGSLRFDDQIEIEGVGDGPFSQGGDSGSLIVGADVRGVALLFAGGDQGGSNGRGLTYANPLRSVLDALKVDLLF